jgi:O-antigen ligase
VPFIIGASVSMLLVLPIAFRLVFYGQRLIFNLGLIMLLGFLLVQILGAIFSRYFDVAANNLISYITEGIILYFLVVNNIRNPESLRRAIWTLLIAGAFLGMLSFYQQITGTFSNNYWGFAQSAGESFGTGAQNLQGAVTQNRLGGPVGEKNYYAQIMLVLIPLGLFQLQSERSNLLRLLAAGATMAIFIGIVLTFSRGVAVGFVLMLLVMVIMRYVKFQQIIFVLIGVFLLFQLFPQYSKRLVSLQSLLTITQQDAAGAAGTDTATQGRIGEMTAAWLVFLDHPFIGVGPGMFKYYYPDYVERVGLAAHTGTREAHDLYLGIAADHGLIGLMVFLLIVGVTLRNLEKTRRQTRQTHPNISNMATAFFLAIISYLTTGIFLSLAFERYFWLILGLADALIIIAAEQQSVVSESLPNSVQ